MLLHARLAPKTTDPPYGMRVCKCFAPEANVYSRSNKTTVIVVDRPPLIVVVSTPLDRNGGRPETSASSTAGLHEGTGENAAEGFTLVSVVL